MKPRKKTCGISEASLHQKDLKFLKHFDHGPMAIIHRDFKEFLRLLKEHNVRYLLIGGYAVSCYGYPQFTADIDIWIAVDDENAVNIVRALKIFGFGMSELEPGIFTEPGSIIRMGIKPNMIEIMTTISGVEFPDRYGRRNTDIIDGVEVDIISLEDLKKNKLSAARPRDLADLEYL